MRQQNGRLFLLSSQKLVKDNGGIEKLILPHSKSTYTKSGGMRRLMDGLTNALGWE